MLVITWCIDEKGSVLELVPFCGFLIDNFVINQKIIEHLYITIYNYNLYIIIYNCGFYYFLLGIFCEEKKTFR